jgi:hypothetical protein
MENKTSEQVINELFGFGKKTDLEKLKDREAKYAPVNDNGTSSVPAVSVDPSGAIAVADPKELSKRLNTAFGMEIGSHTVKSMAGKAVKTFPIIMSDDISPDTAVMMKTMFEDRYAAYIQLLVSNQVIDVTTLNPDDKDENMALQALNKLDGTDFGTERVAHKMQSTGELTADDLGKNLPIMPIIRSMQVQTFESKSENFPPEVQGLLENAIIVNDSDVPATIKLLRESLEKETVEKPLTEGIIPADNEDEANNLINELSMNPPTLDPAHGDLQTLIDICTMLYNNMNSHHPAFNYSNADQQTVRYFYNPNSHAVNNAHNNHAPVDYILYSCANENDFNTFVTRFPAVNAHAFAASCRHLAELIHRDIQAPRVDPEEGGQGGGHGDGHDNRDSNVIFRSIHNDSAHGEVDTSVAAMLDLPENKMLKKKFTEAGYLLTSYRISGSEYISYMLHIGIPVTEKTQHEILLNFKASDVQYDATSYSVMGGNISGRSKYSGKVRALNNRIADSRTDQPKRRHLLFSQVYPAVGGAAFSAVGFGITAATGGLGAIMGAGITSAMTALGASIGGLSAGPFALVGAGLGAGAGVLAGVTAQAFARHRARMLQERVQGWERVEYLIDQMEKNQYEATSYRHDPAAYMKSMDLYDNKIDKDGNEVGAFGNFNSKDYLDFSKESDKTLTQIADRFVPPQHHDERQENGQVNESLASSLEVEQPINVFMYDNEEELQEDLKAAIEEAESLDNLTEADLKSIEEAKSYLTISTKVPGEIKPSTITKYKLDDKYTSLMPSYATKNMSVYGTVEYDRKEMADRKYNEPLILTIKFKDKFSDEKTDNNSLTAVIGILGVVTRVPSNEMVKVLESSLNGGVLKNFFGNDQSNSAKDIIANIIAKVNNSGEELPTSGKVWRNLSKISDLAAANALAGSNSGNVSNAHLVFSQKEIDTVKHDTGTDYLHDAKASAKLMKDYAAFQLTICNDALQVVYTFDNPESISWDAVPYSAYSGHSSKDQVTTALSQISRMMIS